MSMTRREWLAWSLGAGAAAAAGWRATAFAGAAADAPHMTVIPSTGEKLPCVGIGTVDYRGDPSSAAMGVLRDTLQAFHRLGGRVLDTSPNYGNSEEVLGRLLTDMGIRDDMWIATKVDREDEAGGKERMEGSFGGLRGPIQLMQVHNLRGVDVQLQTLAEWKAEGRFRYIGITTHRVEQHDEIERYMLGHDLDFVQLNYSVVDRAAADRLLPLAQERGVAVLVNRPFGDGNLFRIVRGRPLPGWAADIDAGSWAQVMLKYIIAHPAATLPIPGTTKPHHAEDNAGAMYGRLPDAALRLEMARYFDNLV
jgi:aryl-alcohol dehydrogenase-like predicted oxidoreductase